MISIPFTRDEWGYIANAISDQTDLVRGSEWDFIMLNIIDRIEKSLGVE
jgi:hypothetical protein